MSPARWAARQRRSPAMIWYGLVAAAPRDEDRLNDAVLADRGGQRLKLLFVPAHARLRRVRLQCIDIDLRGRAALRFGADAGDERFQPTPQPTSSS